VKAFEIARLGAVGIYSDVSAYNGFVEHGEDGFVLPVDRQLWEEHIVLLLQDGALRQRLALRMLRKLATRRQELCADQSLAKRLLVDGHPDERRMAG
jgi:hypothetical protein